MRHNAGRFGGQVASSEAAWSLPEPRRSSCAAVCTDAISSARRAPRKRARGNVLATRLAEWASRLTFADLPADVIASTKLRVLDVLALSLAGPETPSGRSTPEIGGPHAGTPV